MKYNNWALNENSDLVKPVFNNYTQYASFFKTKGVAFNLDLSAVESFIDWEKYTEKYSFWYYYIDCETDIAERFKETSLLKYAAVYMDLGKRDPICEIPMNVFTEKWLDFVSAAQFETTAITPDGCLFMEFRKSDLLFSNFKIK